LFCESYSEIVFGNVAGAQKRLAEQLVRFLLLLQRPFKLLIVDDTHFYEYLADFLFS